MEELEESQVLQDYDPKKKKDFTKHIKIKITR